MKYTVDYFIKKFEAIPEGHWTIGTQCDNSGRCCAFGHLGVKKQDDDNVFYMEVYGTDTEEGRVIAKMFEPLGYDAVARVNNGLNGDYQQSTPKQRILAALYDIKAMQDGQATAPVEAPKPCADTIVGEFIPVTYKAMELVSAN